MWRMNVFLPGKDALKAWALTTSTLHSFRTRELLSLKSSSFYTTSLCLSVSVCLYLSLPLLPSYSPSLLTAIRTTLPESPGRDWNISRTREEIFSNVNYVWQDRWMELTSDHKQTKRERMVNWCTTSILIPVH